MPRPFPVIVLLLFVVAGCSDDSSDPQWWFATSEFELPVRAVAGNTDIDCDAELTGLGTSGVDASITSFAFYLHDLRLVTDTGDDVEVTLDSGDFQYNDIVLLDFQDRTDMCDGTSDKPVNKVVTGSWQALPGTEIAGLAFSVGIPEAYNHADTASAPSPLNRIDLFWSWQSGHKFVRTDIKPSGGVSTSEGDVMTWNFHLGSTGCEGSPELGEVVTCSAQNRPSISLDGYSPGDILVFDYAALVAASIVNQDQGGAPGCMSGTTDPECRAVFDALGLGIAGDADENPGQAVFRLESGS